MVYTLFVLHNNFPFTMEQSCSYSIQRRDISVWITLCQISRSLMKWEDKVNRCINEIKRRAFSEHYSLQFYRRISFLRKPSSVSLVHWAGKTFSKQSSVSSKSGGSISNLLESLGCCGLQPYCGKWWLRDISGSQVDWVLPGEMVESDHLFPVPTEDLGCLGIAFR